MYMQYIGVSTSYRLLFGGCLKSRMLRLCASVRASTAPFLMTSQKQIELNRRNALKSTGPKTPEGKASSRLNSLQHGLTGTAQIVIAGEDPEQYVRLLESIRTEFALLGDLGAHLIEQLGQQLWRLRRVSRFEAALLAWQQRADLIGDRRAAKAPIIGRRRESPHHLPTRAEGDRPSPGADDHAVGGNEFDDLHRLGRALKMLLSEDDYLHRLGRYETMLAKNCDRTLRALLHLRSQAQRDEFARKVAQTHPVVDPKTLIK